MCVLGLFPDQDFKVVLAALITPNQTVGCFSLNTKSTLSQYIVSTVAEYSLFIIPSIEPVLKSLLQHRLFAFFQRRNIQNISNIVSALHRVHPPRYKHLGLNDCFFYIHETPPHLLHFTAISNMSLHCICLVLPLTRTLELLHVRWMACITSRVAKPMAEKVNNLSLFFFSVLLLPVTLYKKSAWTTAFISGTSVYSPVG